MTEGCVLRCTRTICEVTTWAYIIYFLLLITIKFRYVSTKNYHLYIATEGNFTICVYEWKIWKVEVITLLLLSLSNATNFYFKIQLQSHLKFLKCHKSHTLFYCCDMFRALQDLPQATLNSLKLPHGVSSYVNTLHSTVGSHTRTHAIFILRLPRSVPFVRSPP